MVCARVRAIMHSLTLVHYRYVHVHNHGISKTYFIVKTIVGTKNLDPSAFIIVFQLFHIHKICDLVKVKLGIKEQLTNFYFFLEIMGIYKQKMSMILWSWVRY